MDPYVTESDRRRTDAVKYENLANNATILADDLILAGDTRAAAVAFKRAATHYRMSAAARRDASALPGGTGIDLHIAELLDRDARDYDERAATLSAE
jgi:hypothetical protein